jgi:hypothetical protein
MAVQETSAHEEQHQQADNVVAFVPGLPRESNKLKQRVKATDPDRDSKRARALFWAINGMMNAAVGGPGADRKACSKVMHAADTRLAAADMEQTADVADLRVVLRARCGLCTNRCKRRLV